LSRLGATVFAATCLAFAANAQTLQTQSQQSQMQSPSQPQAQSPANISDEKLGAAAAALQRVAGIKQDYEQRLATADDGDKQRLVDEANNELVKAVTDQGLSVDEYTQIMVVAQNDPQVRDKILQHLHP
jgi:glucose/arabinose dehydrogenase